MQVPVGIASVFVNSKKWDVASLMTSAARPYTPPTACLNSFLGPGMEGTVFLYGTVPSF